MAFSSIVAKCYIFLAFIYICNQKQNIRTQWRLFFRETLITTPLFEVFSWNITLSTMLCVCNFRAKKRFNLWIQHEIKIKFCVLSFFYAIIGNVFNARLQNVFQMRTYFLSLCPFNGPMSYFIHILWLIAWHGFNNMSVNIKSYFRKR